MSRLDVFRSATASGLAFLLVATSTPISGAEPASAIGTLRGSGKVLVRNTATSGETTLFTGDHVSTGSKSYAAITSKAGNRIELISDSEVAFESNGSLERGNLIGGTLSFATSRTPGALAVGQFEIRPSADSSGIVSYVGSDYVGVRAVRGTMTIVNVKDNSAARVATGKDSFMNLRTGQLNLSLTTEQAAAPVQLAAAQGGPQGPGGTQQPPTTPPSSNGGLSGAAWAGILAAAGGGIVAIVVLTKCDKSASPSKNC